MLDGDRAAVEVAELLQQSIPIRIIPRFNTAVGSGSINEMHALDNLAILPDDEVARRFGWVVDEEVGNVFSPASCSRLVDYECAARLRPDERIALRHQHELVHQRRTDNNHVRLLTA